MATHVVRVVITGGAGVIGQALSRSWAADGAEIHLLDVDPTVETLGDGDRVTGYQCDAADPVALARLPAWDHVDVLVNGAGAWPRTTIDDLDPELWDRLLRVNLTSAYATTRALLSPLRAAPGAVVNLSSALALNGHPEQVAYATAKAGLLGFTRSLSQALGPDGIRVNAVAPGLVRTRDNETLWGDKIFAETRRSRPLTRDQHPDDVVGVVRWAASAGAGFVTGQTLVVDGGRTPT